MTGNRSRVILYGDSLILAGVRASLETCPDLETLVLEQALDDPLKAIQASSPAAFIFDMKAVLPNFLHLLLQLPDLMLIGIDPETHQALVWSGRQEAAVVAADLVNVIRKGTSFQSAVE